MTYIVKDTFVYTGDNNFETLDEFLVWFWLGPFDDFLADLPTKTDIPNAVDVVTLMKTNVVEEHWNPETKTYVRAIDYGDPITYLSNRTVIYSIQYLTNPLLEQNMNLIKTTEIIE